MTDKTNTTTPGAGAIIMGRTDAERLESGLGYITDVLGGLLDRPDQDGRLTVGALGLIDIAAHDLLGIVDGWGRRVPTPEPYVTDGALTDVMRDRAFEICAHAKAGGVYPDCRAALAQVEDARGEADDAVKLIGAAMAEMSDPVGSAALDKAHALVDGLASRLKQAEGLLKRHAEADQTGGPAHA